MIFVTHNGDVSKLSLVVFRLLFRFIFMIFVTHNGDVPKL